MNYIDSIAQKINSITHMRDTGAIEDAKKLAHSIFEQMIITSNDQRLPDFVWSDIGLEFYLLEDYNQAELAFLKALEEGEKLDGDDRRVLPAILGDLASVYEKQQSFEKALQLYKEALELKQKSKRNPEVIQLAIKDVERVEAKIRVAKKA